MEVVDAIVKNFVSWWCDPTGEHEMPPLAESFVYDDGLEPTDRASFLWIRRRMLAFKGVVFVHVLSTNNVGAIMFEATDAVTNLRHRMSWFVEFAADGQIAGLTTCAGIGVVPDAVGGPQAE